MPSETVNVHVHIHTGADEARVTQLEEHVGVIDQQIIDLNAKVEEYNQDVQAKIAELEAAISANDPVAIQAALDTLKATVDAGVSAVGDADGDGNPAAGDGETDPNA